MSQWSLSPPTPNQADPRGLWNPAGGMVCEAGAEQPQPWSLGSRVTQCKDAPAAL